MPAKPAAHAWLTGALAAFLLTACGKSAPEAPASPDGEAGAVTPVVEKPDYLPAYHALVIGISDYSFHGAEGWDDLNTARKDAEAVASTLEQEFGFTVTRLLDAEATRQNIMAALDQSTALSEDDALLVYYAGHGYYDETTDEGYWIPRDARHVRGTRPAREDWIWNSTITKLLDTSRARHVLLIADSCYSGAMFRGGKPLALGREFQWYKRAMKAPSRYLITSGDLEPVLDSGAGHSIFARQLLNYLQHTERNVFSASDLGQAIKEKVSSMTGQLVRMGQMPVASHAGGEFVFVRDPGRVVDTGGEDPDAELLLASIEPVTRSTPQERLRDALVMASQGATNGAAQIVAAMDPASVDDRLLGSVRAYLDRDQQARKRTRLREVIDRLANRKSRVDQQDAGAAPGNSPRVISVIGPESSVPGDAASAQALLYRILLQAELEQSDDVVVVEREHLEGILQEMDLGSSDLSDPSARLQLGKILPAGFLLVGNLLPGKDGEQVHLRLVDTETTRILGTFRSDPGDPAAACAVLAGEVLGVAAKR